MKKIYKLGIAILVILFIIIYIMYPLFYNINYDTYMKLSKNTVVSPDDKIWVKLKYMSSTGVSWSIEDSSDKTLDGYAIIENLIDLHYLKINRNFLLDAKGHIIVSTKNVEHINYKGESVVKINPDKIYIYIDGVEFEDKNFTMTDMSFIGVIKALIGLFIPTYRYSV